VIRGNRATTKPLLDVFPRVDLFDAPIDGFFQFDEGRIGVVLVDAVERLLEGE
jgi:hypothetical protein